jgi:hypothetical protein
MVKYEQVVHDGPHTMEQRLYLLSKQAAEVWSIWCKMDNESISQLKPSMQRLYQEIATTDIFMSGVHHGEKHPNK